MLKNFLKKNHKKYFFNKLIFFYKKYLVEYYSTKYLNMYTSNVEVCLPSRQHYICVSDLKKKKISSTGCVLAVSNINLKYYKRSTKSNTGHILFLQKLFLLKYIYLYYVSNFNQRQWVFFQKFWTLVSPSILIVQHKKSFNSYFRPVKRLKKRITKLLLKG